MTISCKPLKYRTIPKVCMIAVLLTAPALGLVYSQGGTNVGQKRGGEEAAGIISAVETGIMRGDVSLFSPYFDRRVYVNIRGNREGYYSSNQADQIIRYLFSQRKVIRFEFTRRDISGVPFATGPCVFLVGGQSERSQIYIELSKSDGGWRISQFNIY